MKLISGLTVFSTLVAAMIYPAFNQSAAIPAAMPWYATISRTCAPWDGPAFVVAISQHKAPIQQPPWIDVAIWQNPAFDQSVTFTFSGDTQKGRALFWTTPRSYQELKGQIWFQRVREPEAAIGRFKFVTPDGKQQQGSFKAIWLLQPNRALCG